MFIRTFVLVFLSGKCISSHIINLFSRNSEKEAITFYERKKERQFPSSFYPYVLLYCFESYN